MFSIEKPAPDRLDIHVSGQLDAPEMKKALDELQSKSEGIENGKMLFRMGEFRLPTLDAIMVEFGRWPSMFGFLGKFSRCALLADQVWLQKIGEIEGAIVPGVVIKGFSLDEQAEAEAWLDGWEATAEA